MHRGLGWWRSSGQGRETCKICYISYMTTTLRIDDEIYRKAKVEAAREGITLTRFIEEALQLRLQHGPAIPAIPGGPVALPTFAADQGFDLSPGDLKRLLQESGLDYDLAKLERG